jgi:5-bromo-4-chloroindolyl phosphate hydrolysis protein
MNEKTKKLLTSLLPGVIGGILFCIFSFFLNFNFFISIGIGLAGLIAGSLIFTGKNKEIEFISEGIDKKQYNEIIQSGADKLKTLKTYIEKIKTKEVKDKVNAINTVVEKIIDDIKKDPKDVKLAKQFLNYYLDTTILILNKYIDISSQDMKSKKIKDTLVKVENLLDTIKAAFEKQLEKLYSDDLLNLDTEIQVLEQTFKVEGLE